VLSEVAPLALVDQRLKRVVFGRKGPSRERRPSQHAGSGTAKETAAVQPAVGGLRRSFLHLPRAGSMRARITDAPENAATAMASHICDFLRRKTLKSRAKPCSGTTGNPGHFCG